MDLPPNLSKLIQRTLEAVRQDPEQNLTIVTQNEIYENFGLSRLHLPPYSKRGQELANIGLDEWLKGQFLNFSIADYALCWLAVLTARKVEFICERVLKLPHFDITEVDEVKEILNTSEAVLNKSITFEEGSEVLEDHWYFLRPDLTVDIYCAWVTAMHALTLIINGPKSREKFCRFADTAEKAYTVTDRNLSGEGQLPDPPIPLEYDLKKRLEFWEWWLTEAIPQAWELAHRNLPNEIQS